MEVREYRAVAPVAAVIAHELQRTDRRRDHEEAVIFDHVGNASRTALLNGPRSAVEGSSSMAARRARPVPSRPRASLPDTVNGVQPAPNEATMCSTASQVARSGKSTRRGSVVETVSCDYFHVAIPNRRANRSTYKGGWDRSPVANDESPVHQDTFARGSRALPPSLAIIGTAFRVSFAVLATDWAPC